MSPHDFTDDAPEHIFEAAFEDAEAAFEDARAQARLADAVRAALAPDEARLSHDAARAFASVHLRLMEAIDLSRHGPGRAAAPEAVPEAVPEAASATPSARASAPLLRAAPVEEIAPGRAVNSARSARSVQQRGGSRSRLQVLEGERKAFKAGPARGRGAGAGGRGVRVLGAVRSCSASAIARYAAAACVLAAGVIGGHHAGRESGPRALPVQSIVEDYASGLGPSAPLEVSARSTGDTSRWLSKHMGRRVSLPTASRVGATLLGARRCTVEGRLSAQAHYLKNGVRVAYYQIHAPHLGLAGLGEVRSGGRSYFTQNLNGCNLIAWRSDEDIMAVVSPLEMPVSLSLAYSMRESTPAQDGLDASDISNDG